MMAGVRPGGALGAGLQGRWPRDCKGFSAARRETFSALFQMLSSQRRATRQRTSLPRLRWKMTKQLSSGRVTARVTHGAAGGAVRRRTGLARSGRLPGPLAQAWGREGPGLSRTASEDGLAEGVSTTWKF